MACNSQNGKTYYNSLTPYPGGTDASASYLMDCTHYTCGNRQMCVTADGFPLASSFDIQVLGVPRPVGDKYCCDIRCICDLTYQQVYRCGGGCPNKRVYYSRDCLPFRDEPEKYVLALYDRLQREKKEEAEKEAKKEIEHE